MKLRQTTLPVLLACALPLSTQAELITLRDGKGDLVLESIQLTPGGALQEILLDPSKTVHWLNPNPDVAFQVSAEASTGARLRLDLHQFQTDPSGVVLKTESLISATQGDPNLSEIDLPAVLPGAGAVFLTATSDAALRVKLSINRLAPSGDAVNLTDSAADAPNATGPLGGPADRRWRCLRPSAGSLANGLDVSLLLSPGVRGELELRDADDQKLENRAGPGRLTIGSLGSGAHAICLRANPARGEDPGRWLLLATPGDAAVNAREPDSTPGTYGVLTTEQPHRGTLDVDDLDVLRPVHGDPATASGPDGLPAEALVRASFRAEIDSEVCLRVGSDQTECQTGDRFDIGPFRVTPETRLTAKPRGKGAGRYEMVLTPDTSGHYPEPNAKPGQQVVHQGPFRLKGTLDTAGDIDTVTFHAGDRPQIWRFLVMSEFVDQVKLDSPRGVAAQARRAERSARRIAVPDVYLDSGPAHLTLRGRAGPYTLIARPLGQPSPHDEREPNDRLPRRLALDETVIGTLGRDDRDTFSLLLPRPADVLLSSTVPAGAGYEVSLSSGGRSLAPAIPDLVLGAGAQEHRLSLPAGEHLLSLEPRQPSPAEYRFSLSLVSPFTLADAGTIELRGQLDDPVRAHAPYAQRITTDIALSNPGQVPVAGDLVAWSLNPAVQAVPVPVSLAAGSETTARVTLEIPADLTGGRLPLFFAFRPLGEAGTRALGILAADLEADINAAPANPSRDLPAPESLLGGIDVAQQALGAKWVAVPGAPLDDEGDYREGHASRAENLRTLIDGWLTQGIAPTSHEGYLALQAPEVLEPVLSLPGDDPIPIMGFGLDTRSRQPGAVRDVAIDLSNDGSTWEEVLELRHETWGRTTYTAIPQGPKPARFVRLRARTPDQPGKTTLSLNRFAVIAAPGRSGLSNIDLADPAFGALAVALNDALPDPDRFQPPASGEDPAFPVSDDPDQFAHALTFKRQRPAQLDRVELEYTGLQQQPSMPYADRVTVLGSAQGPLGRFQKLAEAVLPDQPQPGQTLSIALPAGVETRALKLHYHGGKSGKIHVPARIRVLERPEGEGYRSVLGLWGDWSPRRAPAPVPASVDITDSEARFELNTDARARTGVVEFQAREETWTVSVPGHANMLAVTLRGEFGFSPSVLVRSEAGDPLTPQEQTPTPDGAGTVLRFPVTAGSKVSVTISEPQRNTVFLIDQSSSIAPYLTSIRRAMVDFAADMQVGRDAIQFKSFGGDFPPGGWIDDPNVLYAALANYEGGDNSAGEAALIDATALLADRAGSRAIVVLTDGDVTRSAGLMNALALGRARVFVMKTPSGGMWQDPAVSQPLMALWTASTHGEVVPVLESQDLSTAFARTSARLLGPKSYTISAEAGVVSQEPGWLELAPNLAPVPEDAEALYVLIDASGSMLKSLRGERRIDIAREALGNYLDVRRGDDKQHGTATRVALRQFGGAAESCETHQLLNFTPLAEVPVTSLLSDIQPENLAKTPIAAALSAAHDDLQGQAGTPSILLITDGEETCDGDPLEEITALQAQGVDTRIDVVSFSLASDVDRSQFEAWAAAGRGVYIDAQSREDLAAALQTTRAARYDVLSGGKIVAVGVVGGAPVFLPAGNYTVRVRGGETIQNVQIQAGTGLLLQ